MRYTFSMTKLTVMTELGIVNLMYIISQVAKLIKYQISTKVGI